RHRNAGEDRVRRIGAKCRGAIIKRHLKIQVITSEPLPNDMLNASRTGPICPELDGEGIARGETQVISVNHLDVIVDAIKAERLTKKTIREIGPVSDCARMLADGI